MATVITWSDGNGTKGRCDGRCHNARGNKCRCLCGGRLHGTKRKGTLDETLNCSGFEILREAERRAAELGMHAASAVIMPLFDR